MSNLFLVGWMRVLDSCKHVLRLAFSVGSRHSKSTIIEHAPVVYTVLIRSALLEGLAGLSDDMQGAGA